MWSKFGKGRSPKKRRKSRRLRKTIRSKKRTLTNPTSPSWRLRSKKNQLRTIQIRRSATKLKKQKKRRKSGSTRPYNARKLSRRLTI